MFNERIITFVQIVICFIAVIVSFIFASTVSLGSDESYTYLNYVYPSIMDSVHRVQLLNNHILNSILIRLFEFITGEKYNEFIIRLPNLLAHIIYAFFAFVFAREFKYKILAICLFMCNWELVRYFAMARGYGMAACGILASSYFLYKWIYYERTIHYYILCMTSLTLAILANSVSLYIELTIVLLILFYLIKDNQLLRYIKIKYNIIFLLVFIFCTFFSLWVSRKVHVTYATHDFYNGFLLSIPIMFTPKVVFDDIIFLMFILLYIYSFVFWPNKLFHLILLGFVGLTIFVNILFDKGYPLSRGMLPIYPIVALVIVQSIENIRRFGVLSIVFSILLVVQFFYNIQFNTSDIWACRRSTMEYIASHNIIENSTQECFDGRDISCRFYLNKFYYYINNKTKK